MLSSRLEIGFFRGLIAWTCQEEGQRHLSACLSSSSELEHPFYTYFAHCYRQKTPSSETIWAAVTHPADLAVSTSADSELRSLTSYFQSSVSISALKVQECIADKHMPVTPCTEPDPMLQVPACEEGENATPSAECSICLERCGGPNGLIQLRCKHIFHSACLERWLRSRGDCPYCRASVLLTSDH